MTQERGSTEARQSDHRKHSFVILIISTALAALLAIGGFVYVTSQDREDLDGGLPEDVEEAQELID